MYRPDGPEGHIPGPVTRTLPIYAPLGYRPPANGRHEVDRYGESAPYETSPKAERMVLIPSGIPSDGCALPSNSIET